MESSKNIYVSPVLKTDLVEAVSDPETHVGWDKFAIDFMVSEGSIVKAAAPGKIIYIKMDSNSGGDEAFYEDFKFYNHIVIKHENGEYTEYGHLKFNGCIRKLGEQVNAGDTIGYAGNTGYSAGPHVHFSVFILKNMPADFEKLPEGKIYFLNDEDFGYGTIQPRFSDFVFPQS
ncbi:MAG: M23 family metallopeptidase [bacterium]|nr:M23 family metallopeptidase [bacterium]